jgi:hypothetical protein
MFSRLLSLFTTAGRKARGQASPRRPRRQSSSDLRLEELESRLVPAPLPLHVAGALLQDSNNNTVVLRGVNITGLESYPTGLTGDASQVLRSVDVALNDWHANLIRLTVYPDFWFGQDRGVGLGVVDPKDYRSLIDQIVAKASAQNAYVMLAVWGSDMGDPTLAPALRDLPDYGTQTFWRDAAAHTMLVDNQGNPTPNGPSYANNAAVLFDPFNEPHNNSGMVGWYQWRNGGTVTETSSKEGRTLTYSSPGMQGLLNTIRAAGANNVVALEGLGYSADLSGVGAGLIDPTGNQMYQLHLYPAQWQSAAHGDALARPVTRFPIYVGEFGTPSGADDSASEFNGVPQQGASQWTKDMLTWVDQHQYSWTAWSLVTYGDPNHTAPSLISDWNYTPTDYFGAIVKASLTTHAANAAATTAALSALETAAENAAAEYNYALATNSPGQGFALASLENSLVAWTYAQAAANTQSAADWATAEQFALLAQANALSDYISGNPYAATAQADDLIAYALAQAVVTPETV